ncbi:hypothetical protein HN51_039677, partial [Arachis hypogaea]
SLIPHLVASPRLIPHPPPLTPAESQSPLGHHHAVKDHHAELHSARAHHHAESQSARAHHHAVKVHRPCSALVGRRTPPCYASLRLPPLPCSSPLFSCSSLPICFNSVDLQ